MYILITLADVVQIPPSEFSKPSAQAIEEIINAKYADKVIHKVGLCVGFFDLLSTSEGLIGHGTGIVNVNVDFRMIVFRPFKGEILEAIITESDLRGIHLSMDFFEDIEIPGTLLFEGSSYDDHERCYIWRTEDGTEMFFDRNEVVQFRVEAEEWTDLSPQQQRPPQEDEDMDGQVEERKPPYKLFGSMMHSGLGPTLWWAD